MYHVLLSTSCENSAVLCALGPSKNFPDLRTGSMCALHRWSGRSTFAKAWEWALSERFMVLSSDAAHAPTSSPRVPERLHATSSSSWRMGSDK